MYVYFIPWFHSFNQMYTYNKRIHILYVGIEANYGTMMALQWDSLNGIKKLRILIVPTYNFY